MFHDGDPCETKDELIFAGGPQGCRRAPQHAAHFVLLKLPAQEPSRLEASEMEYKSKSTVSICTYSVYAITKKMGESPESK